MALTTIPSELSSVSGIADSSDATAITIDSSENVKINQKLSIGTTSTEGILNLAGQSNLTWGTDYSAIGSIPNSQGLLLGNNIKVGATNNTVIRHANGTDAGTFIKLAYNKGVTFHTGIATTLDAEVSEDSNERVRIDTTGKVGIGTTTPDLTLHVDGTNGLPAASGTTPNGMLTLRDKTGSATHGLYVGVSNASPWGSWIQAADAGNLATEYPFLLNPNGGYVGIGETSPDNKLHITGGDWNNAHIKIERTDVGGSNDAGLVFKSAAGAAIDTGLGGIWFQNALDSNAYALIRARTDDSSGTSGRLDFMTGSSAVGNGTSAAMSIRHHGSVHIGGLGVGLDSNYAALTIKDNNVNRSADCTLYVDSGGTADWTARIGGSYEYALRVDTTSSASYAIGAVADSSSWKFRVQGNGSIYAVNTDISSISDRRLKENITDAKSQWDDIKALKWKNFNWTKESGHDDGKTKLGLIADEVEKISPNLIQIDAQSKEDKDAGKEDPEYKTVKYSIVWVKAMKALQEAMERIETLESEVKTLKGG